MELTEQATAQDTALSAHIQEQMARLERGAQGIVPDNGLAEKLLKAERTGKPLKIKLGLDPTAPDIHLGFAVVLRKLRQFQDLGHQVIIIIGDYTALIGDPSGRSATRPMLTTEAIEANARTYVDQLARILDRDKTTVRFNGEWLGKLGFADVISAYLENDGRQSAVARRFREPAGAASAHQPARTAVSAGAGV